jgi:hypothetical protein
VEDMKASYPEALRVVAAEVRQAKSMQVLNR